MPKRARRCVSAAVLPAPGPYRIPHVKVDGYAVYTNKPVAGSYRGYGIPQGAWAGEQQMDEIAKRLGMDPVEIRMKNIFVEGDVSYWGEQLHAVGLKETLIKATEAIDWGKPHSKRSRESKSAKASPASRSRRARRRLPPPA